MHWLFLAVAVVFETVGTVALQASHQFTRPWPSAVVLVSYAVCFYLLSFTLRAMPVGIVYALWSGLGICLISAIAWVVYGQKLDPAAIAGMALIIAGIAVINLFSASATH